MLRPTLALRAFSVATCVTVCAGAAAVFAPAVQAQDVSTRLAQLRLPACFGSSAAEVLRCEPGAVPTAVDVGGSSQIACRPAKNAPGAFVRVDGVGLNMHQGAGDRLEYAARYRQGRKFGRVFQFDEQGRFAGFDDYENDKMNGMRVECGANGKPTSLSFRRNGQNVDVSLIFEEDGQLMSAGEYHGGSRMDIKDPKRVQQLLRAVPADLCRPSRCDVNAPPQFSLGTQG